MSKELKKTIENAISGKAFEFMKDITERLNEKKTNLYELEKVRYATKVMNESIETTGHLDAAVDAVTGLKIFNKAAPDAQDESDDQESEIQKTMMNNMTEEDEKVCEACGAKLEEDGSCKNCS